MAIENIAKKPKVQIKFRFCREAQPHWTEPGRELYPTGPALRFPPDPAAVTQTPPAANDPSYTIEPSSPSSERGV